ncbi:hypothetical protein TREMEDRAFT_38481 [Tremella mesenterica DSM 1558]|uniref:uncharacterized protein n=1 Tax=Tremella mesenterica (strain ATCC 24925 / CBS 8224 / DSM 1558 / NBRC 9311 / NRRL Y-6157 / RJB 2259-6 / UBC 559-6) TaxID=578456 RepID=UPI0003F4A363|nr:uncharacterized protein TREMEDRAFT_38481 [Tremella mesenterica DSM 1558]EIW70918.1 hypothetical protein TREMEDRAFT_38481 [Tremella mesenterica DSM 1558]
MDTSVPTFVVPDEPQDHPHPHHHLQSDTSTLAKTPSRQSAKSHAASTLTVQDQEEEGTLGGELEKGKDEGGEEEVEDTGLLTGARLYLVFLSMMLTIFMFALDQSIVSTAIPVIVSDFNAFDQVAWIVTGYFLTQCGLILLVGQLLTALKAKWMLLGAIFFFELGSLICAVAHSMNILIFGRAIQGIGSSGIFVSCLAVIATITRVDQRAAFMSAFGIVFVISSVVGPLLGGVFTQRVTWRWCFWINLPVGGIAAAAVLFLLPARPPEKREGFTPGWRGLKQMDYIGTALIFVLVTCLLLALQWGGNEYAWSSWRIILLFTLGAALVPIFAAWEWYRDNLALLPRIFLRNRTEVAAAIAMFFYSMVMLGGVYQLPLYYQAGRGHTPEKSGIDIIPFMIMVCVGIFVAGGVTTKTGRYWYFLAIAPPIAAVGFGLLYTIKPDTSNAKIIGYQILSGFPIGLGFQMPIIAVQAEWSKTPNLIPQATGVLSFFQLTGSALGIGIVNTVQSVYLNKELRLLAPDAPFEVVRQSVSAISTLSPEMQIPVIAAYIIAITKSLIPLIVACGLALASGVFIRNHNMLLMGGSGHAAAL